MNVFFQGRMKSGKSTAMGRFAAAHLHQQLFWVVDRVLEWGPESFFWGEPSELVQVVSKLPKEIPESGALVFRGVEAFQVATWCTQFGGVYLDDEADVVCGVGKWLDNPVRSVIHRGRHLVVEEGPYAGSAVECSAMLAARRCANLPADVSALAEEAYIFNSRGKTTLDRLEDDEFIDAEERELLPHLLKHHFKHWPSGLWLRTEGSGIVYEPVDG